MTQVVRLEAGDKAPDIALPMVGGGIWSLSDALARAEKGAVVYFYPRAMTPGCTKEACDFRDAHAAFDTAGYEVVGISPDSLEKAEKFAQKEKLNFPLACDEDKHVMTAYGAYGEKKNYGKIVQGVIRSTFVIGKDGVITSAKYGVKASGHVDRLRKELGITSVLSYA